MGLTSLESQTCSPGLVCHSIKFLQVLHVNTVFQNLPKEVGMYMYTHIYIIHTHTQSLAFLHKTRSTWIRALDHIQRGDRGWICL